MVVGVVAIPVSVLLAQSKEEELEITIQGVVQEIAADKSYIIVDGTKIITESDFFEYCDLTIGEKVVIFAEKTDKGLTAFDCASFYVDDIESNEDATEESFEDILEDSELDLSSESYETIKTE